MAKRKHVKTRPSAKPRAKAKPAKVAAPRAPAAADHVMSQADVARHFGISRAAVNQWKANHADCPLRKPKPWSLRELADWRERTLQPVKHVDLPHWSPKPGGESGGSEPGQGADQTAIESLPPTVRAKMAHVVVKTQLEQFKLARAKGEYLPLEDVRRERRARAQTFRTVMESIPQLLIRHDGLDGLDEEWRQRVEITAEAIVAEALLRMAGPPPMPNSHHGGA